MILNRFQFRLNCGHHPRNYLIITTAILFCAAFIPDVTWATQGHGGVEGIYVHQLAHLFFMVAMGILIYWLRRRRLTRQSGWYLIQLSAFWFILWNLSTIGVHLLEEQLQVILIEKLTPWQIKLDTHPPNIWVACLYYVIKLDHLLCVPAMISLYMGLRRLLQKPPPRALENIAP